MAVNEKKENFSSFCLIGAMFLVAATCYWEAIPLLYKSGVDLSALNGFNSAIMNLKSIMSKTYYIRGFILMLVLASALQRQHKANEKPIVYGILWSAFATIVMLLPVQGTYYYLLCIPVGFFASIYGYGLITRHVDAGVNPEEEESFLQFDSLIDTEDSINIPYHYTYQKKLHKAWINIVAPFRASLVMGVPGSGKSFAIYNKCIEDMVRKGYTFFLYDYKFPDLTEELLTEIYYQKTHENLWKDEKHLPKLYILNFDDAKRSNRCNPIHHTYITDPADTTEIADLLFKNINKGTAKGGFDFFNESAKVFLDALTWFLANYDPDAIYGGADGYTVIGSSSDYKKKGIYCTFPHIIELMAYNYKKTFQILQYTHGLEAKISPFASALEGGAMEQLQGQIASAQIPLGKFVSPALYWIMTGDDFTLDINNPNEPKIVCMGNNPDRQSIYGSAIALYTSRMFKLINHKHKRKSAVLLDELPTVFIKGLDNLIATARSNKVAIIAGAQDRSQFKRDYGQEEADVIIATVGNIMSGQVNTETAKFLSEMFGKEFREQQSRSISLEAEGNNSKSLSYHQQEIMPAAKIGTLSQGMFVGRVADNFDTPIDRKLWSGNIDVDTERAKAKRKIAQKVPIMTDFFGGKIPVVPEKDLERLGKMYPKLKDDSKALTDKYIDEEVNKAIMRQFEKVKREVKEIVEKEYERTKPFADAAKAQEEEDDEE